MLGFSAFPVWIVVVAVFLIAIALLIRFSNNINVLSFIRTNFFYFFLMLLLAIFVISIINIQSSYSIDYSTLEGWKSLAGIYANWLWNFVSNIGKVTGYAIKQDWVAHSANSTG